MYKTREEYHAEKKRLEKNGLLPDYDYPDSSNIQTDTREKHRTPATALNNNPGPGSYTTESQFGKWGKGFSFTTKFRSDCQCMWTEQDDSQKHQTRVVTSRKKNNIPVDTVPGWKEKTKVSGSVYQNTHNAQALSTKKVEPESRGKPRHWHYHSYDKREGPFYSLAGRTLYSDRFRLGSSTPGPGTYGIYSTLHRKEYSFGFRHGSIHNNTSIQMTDQGLVSLT